MAKEKKNPIKNFFAEFKKFITRGNVLDMAVGVIVGGAFTAIVNGVSNYVLKPLINWFLAFVTNGDGLKGAITMLSPAYQTNADGLLLNGQNGMELAYDLANSIYLDWGALITTVINFLITAFVLFLIVRTINKIAENNKKLKADLTSTERKEIKKIRKEEKVGKVEAEAIYLRRIEEAKAAAAEEARLAEEKAMANTMLLAEIRDLLKNK